MGGPPITLLKRGSLVARMGESQSELDKLVPISYIMEWIGKQLDNKAPHDHVGTSDHSTFVKLN